MTTVNEDLLDASIRHALFLERYKAGMIKKIIALLDDSSDTLFQMIQDRYSKIKLRGSDTGPVTTKRLEQLLEALVNIRQQAHKKINKALLDEIAGLVEYEIPFMVKMISGNIPAEIAVAVSLTTPTVAQTLAAVYAQPFKGKLLKGILRGYEASDIARIQDTIRLGYMTQQTTPQIVRQLFGTKTSAGVMQGTRHQVAAITRTALQHTAMQTRRNVALENNSVIKEAKYIATLDSRTTAICRGLDGQVWKIDNPQIRWPPQHFQCRSSMIYITKSWRELGIKADEASPGTRASMNGQVPDRITYNEWLRKQSAKVQNEVLGVKKAQLFRKGKVPIDKFTNPVTGQELTLDQLRVKESDAWNKVFGNNQEA